MIKNIYLIHPIENLTKKEKDFLDDYVLELEAHGNRVHYPIRDVGQNQDGFKICLEHRKAIKEVKEVHIYWTKKSRGSLFDFGMAFSIGKKIVLINKNQVKRTKNKSYENLLLDLHDLSNKK